MGDFYSFLLALLILKRTIGAHQQIPKNSQALLLDKIVNNIRNKLAAGLPKLKIMIGFCNILHQSFIF